MLALRSACWWPNLPADCMYYRSAVCIPLGAMHDTASFNTQEGLAEHAAKETTVAAGATQVKQRCELTSSNRAFKH